MRQQTEKFTLNLTPQTLPKGNIPIYMCVSPNRTIAKVMLINYESMLESEEKVKTRTAEAHTKNMAQKTQTKLYNCAEKSRRVGDFRDWWGFGRVQQSADVHMSSLRRHCVCFNQR